MHHRLLRPLQSVKGFPDNMLPGLGQHLYRHIIRYHIPLDQRPQELILRIGSRRKSHLNLFKADLNQQFKEIQLLLQRHGHHKSLIAIPQIHAAPDGSMVHIFLICPAGVARRRHKILSGVLLAIHHFSNPPFSL